METSGVVVDEEEEPWCDDTGAEVVVADFAGGEHDEVERCYR